MEQTPQPTPVKPEKKYVGPVFQILTIAFTSLVILRLLQKAADHAYVLDARSEIYSFTPQEITKFGGSGGVVKIGLYVRDFPEFDMIANKFVLSGKLTFEFDPALISLDTLSKFSFEKGEILSVAPPTTRLVKGQLFASYDIRVRFTTNLSFEFFPIDEHRIEVIVLNQSLTPSDVIFDSSNNNFNISPHLFISGWKQVDTDVKAGYAMASLDKQDPSKNVYTPRVIFSIDYTRLGIRNALTIILPLMLLFFISLFSFSLDPDIYVRSIITLAAAGVSALIAYRFVIENMSPKVGYFMLSDYLFFLFLSANCLIFIFASVGMFFSAFYKEIMCLILHAYIIVGNVYLFMFWLR